MPFRVGGFHQFAWCGRRDLPACGRSGGAEKQSPGLFFNTHPSSPCIYTRNKGTIQKDDAFVWCGRRDLPHLRVGAVPRENRPLDAFLTRGLQVPFHINQKNTGITRWAMPVFWCGRRDLNPYGVIHTPLKRARLPVPPLPHVVIDG